MYEVVFDKEAIEFLEKCEKNLAKRIWNKIMSPKRDPYHFFSKLVNRDDYRLRVGDYRVIADIKKNERRIEITLIVHRKNIYQNI